MNCNQKHRKICEKKAILVLYLCLLAVILAVGFNNEKAKTNSSFLITNEPIQSYSVTRAIFSNELIPQPAFLLSAHSATLTTLTNGDILAMWFAGSHEGNPDVKIWQSIYSHGKWQMAHAAISPDSLRESLSIYVRKIGNPVVYRALDGKLHLFVVSVAIGGWSGSRLNHFISTDKGRTWHLLGRLVLSPFFNLSTLVRTNPITLADGGFYLPVYHEFIKTYPELLQFDKNGKFIRQIRLSDNGFLLQPSVVPVSAQHAMVFLRNKALTNDILYKQDTYDGGTTWTSPAATNLINHDSSIAVTRVNNKLFLMVHNIYSKDNSSSYMNDRGLLMLAISSNGRSWRDIYALEHDYKYEFSYPAIMINNNIIDILYTWRRKQIKHVRFNLAWLMEHTS